MQVFTDLLRSSGGVDLSTVSETDLDNLFEFIDTDGAAACIALERASFLVVTPKYSESLRHPLCY